MTNVVPMSRPLRLALLADAAASGATCVARRRCWLPRRLAGPARGADARSRNGADPIRDPRRPSRFAAGRVGQCSERDRGELLGEPMDIPGVGSYVSVRDTEGNRVAMLQPLPVMQVRPH
jgi:hypothetical protein